MRSQRTDVLDLVVRVDVDRGVAGDAEDARERIQVLVERDLEERRAALAVRWSTTHTVRSNYNGHVPRSDGGRGEEVEPYTVPAVAVSLDDLVLVADPVLVPAPEGSRVVHAEDIDVLDFEAGRLNLVDDPTKGARGVRTGEDILVHEEAPDEVFVLPRRTDAGDLEDKETIVLEQVVHLAKEGAVAANADVLSHLEGDDLGVCSAAAGDVTVVEAEDARTGGIAAVVNDALVAELGLVLAESDTSYLAAVVLVREGGKSAPTAANVKQAILRLEVELCKG